MEGGVLMSIRKQWTNAEEDFLYQNYKLGAKFCAQQLRRTSSSAECRLLKLGLFTRRIWDDEKIAFLRQHYSIDGGPDFCAQALNMSLSQVMDMANKQRLQLTQYEYSKRASSFDYDYFSLNKPDCCYMLGLLWADGTLDKTVKRVGIVLVKNDFEYVKDVFSPDRGWKQRELHPKNRQVATLARAHHILFYNFLVENDYMIKSGASASKILAKIPEHLRHYWWRGYLDGDGWFLCCAGQKYGFGFSSCLDQNWDFAESLATTISLTGCHISKRITEHGNSSEFCCNNFDSAYKFGKYIYNGFTDDRIGFTRKYESFVRLVNTKNEYV